MQALNNWMVALDMSEHDDHLISYTYDLAQALVPDQIVFVHVIPRVEIPEKFLKNPLPTRKEVLLKIEAKVYRWDKKHGAE